MRLRKNGIIAWCISVIFSTFALLYNLYIMVPITGILGGIGAASGLISSIIGGNKAAKAAEAQQKALEEQKKNEQAWYARNYYQNYLDSTEAKAAIRRVNDTLARQNEQARAAAVISGATPEAVQAVQEAGNETLSDTMAGIAAQGTARRQAVDAQHVQNQANLSAQQQALDAQRQQGNMNLLNAGTGLIGSALSLYDPTPINKKV